MITAHVKAIIVVEFDFGRWNGNEGFHNVEKLCMEMVERKVSGIGLKVVEEPIIDVKSFSTCKD